MSADIHSFEDELRHIPNGDDNSVDISVEAMEAAHEEVEEARAALLGNQALENTVQHGPFLGEKAQKLYDNLDSGYDSDRRHLFKESALAIGHGEMTIEEFNVLKIKLDKLKNPVKTPQSALPNSSWSPSNILSKMPKSTGRDWAERAANDRHDKE